MNDNINIGKIMKYYLITVCFKDHGDRPLTYVIDQPPVHYLMQNMSLHLVLLYSLEITKEEFMDFLEASARNE